MTSLMYNPISFLLSHQLQIFYLSPLFLSTSNFLSLSIFPIKFIFPIALYQFQISLLHLPYLNMLSFITNAIANPWLKQNLNILMPTSPTNKKSQFSTNFQQFSNLDLATVRLACIPYKNSDESPLSSQFIEKLIAHHKDWFQVFIWKSFLSLMRSYCTFRRKR